MSKIGYVSIPALNQYLATANSLGLQYAPLLERLNLNAEVLADHHHRVPASTLEHLLDNLIPASKDELFGLHTAAFIQPASYSVLGYIAMNCATLKEALQHVPIYEKIVGDMGVTATEEHAGEMLIRWTCQRATEMVPNSQAYSDQSASRKRIVTSGVGSFG